MSYTRWKQNSKLVNVPKTLLALTGILLELLRDNFRYNSEQFKYIDDNPTDSKLLIDSHNKWKPENCNNYPGIYVKRSNWVFRQDGKVIGDYKSFINHKNPYSYDFFAPVSGTYILILIGKTEGEIDILAEEVMNFLLGFEEPIRNFLSFYRFELQSISEIGILDENRQFYTCQLQLGIGFEKLWEVTLEQPVIKSTNINIKS